MRIGHLRGAWYRWYSVPRSNIPTGPTPPEMWWLYSVSSCVNIWLFSMTIGEIGCAIFGGRSSRRIAPIFDVSKWQSRNNMQRNERYLWSLLRRLWTLGWLKSVTSQDSECDPRSWKEADCILMITTTARNSPNHAQYFLTSLLPDLHIKWDEAASPRIWDALSICYMDWVENIGMSVVKCTLLLFREA